MIYGWLLKQAPYFIIGAGLIFVGWLVGYKLIERGRDELRPRVAQLEQELIAERNNRERAERVANGYYEELQIILNRPVPAGPVRLCRASPVPAAGPASGGAAGPAAATGGDAGQTGSNLEAGPDIGPDLFALARDCDTEIARLRALQGWINDVR